MMPKIFPLIAALMLIAAGTVHAEPKAINFVDGVDWTQKVVTVNGEGLLPPEAVNRTQAVGLATKAAQADAYRKLGEIIGGVHVEGNTTVKNLTTTTQINLRVEATIKGAQVISQNFLSGGVCRTVMQVPLFGATNSLASAIFQRPATIEPFPEPIYEPAPTDKPPLSRIDNSSIVMGISGEPVKKSVKDYAALAKGDYTGLIVDCRGLGLKPVMSPVILNTNGTKIYGHKNLDVDKVVAQGMADYVTDPEQVSRAGDNPLIVKAVKLENFDSNPVLDLADSNRVLIENHATKFLKDLKVVFLYD